MQLKHYPLEQERELLALILPVQNMHDFIKYIHVHSSDKRF